MKVYCLGVLKPMGMLALSHYYDHLIGDYHFETIHSFPASMLILPCKRKLKLKFECYTTVPTFHYADGCLDHPPIMYIRKWSVFVFALTGL